MRLTKVKATSILLALVVSGASPVFARETNNALISADQYATCIVKKRLVQARSVVLDSVYDVKKRYPKLLDSSCVPKKDAPEYISKLRFPGDTFHQMLANALVRLEFPVTGPTDFSALDPTEIVKNTSSISTNLRRLTDKDREILKENEDYLQNWRALTMLGDCVARRSPEAIRAMALTIPTTIEEGKAVKALQGDIAACVPAGQKLRVGTSDLRSFSVLAYYHLARALLDEQTPSQRSAT